MAASGWLLVDLGLLRTLLDPLCEDSPPVGKRVSLFAGSMALLGAHLLSGLLRLVSPQQLCVRLFPADDTSTFASLLKGQGADLALSLICPK